jgi:glutamate/tyrosine decarboxylase-like PLP-dependent enzyme
MDLDRDPLAQLADQTPTLALAHTAALAYLEGLLGAPIHTVSAEARMAALAGPLPDEGRGSLAAIRDLIDHALPEANRTSGPRMFHFVTGGVTPAALAADWLASTIDQNAFSWVNSPLAARLEATAIDWLKELFELPATWGGVLTTGATMANFAALGAARHWWAARHGAVVEEAGLTGLPPLPVLSSGWIHTSAVKALAMLGIGRANVHRFAVDGTGRLDLAALEAALADLHGAPAIIVANAGEVNTGAFDPIEAMADLAQRYGAWLHVDGAFGLFARVSPQSAALAAGVERADSVIADGHKWLNVPYDCGFAFVRDPRDLARAFAAGAAYLPSLDDPHPNFGYMGPEMSRRARSLAVWATLAAYGRQGYRAMVERHVALAARVAAAVDAAPDLERLAEAPLDIVCFRYRPQGVPESELDGLNTRLGQMVLDDGRVYVGTTTYGGRVAFRPAIVNWLTTERDVDLLVQVIRDLGASLAGGGH